MYLDAQGNVIPDASLVGYKAIGVPGSVAGLAYAQKKFGKLTLAQVMAPAIRLAREGFALSYEDAQDLRNPHYHLGEFAESRRIFQRDGKFYEPGEILKQPELAQTLERIAKNPDDFYHGEMARQLAAAVAEGRRPDHREGSGGLRGERARAGARHAIAGWTSTARRRRRRAEWRCWRSSTSSRATT